jgi:hypothetical protein
MLAFMPRPANKTDALTSIIDQLADAIAARLHRSAAPARQAPGAAVRGASRRKGEKRPAALLADMTNELFGYIKAHPGERIEQIAGAMGYSTSDLKLPAQKLLAEKKVKTKGERRGTKYFA